MSDLQPYMMILMFLTVLLVVILAGRHSYGRTIRINCTYNERGAWCNNRNMKRSLFGLGARCCLLYPGLNGERCREQVKYPRPQFPPPAPKPRSAGIQPDKPWPRK